MRHSFWVEKYRPKDLSTYIGNEHLKSKVKVYLESEDVPHLLLFGKSGTGKTTLAKIVVNNIDCDYMYINASDENKVDDVRVVIGYASTNTNRVNIPVKTQKVGLTDVISFNANLFKEVLVANRECTSAVLEVSNEGLAKVNFKVDDYDSTYYVVAMQDVD